MARIWTAAQSTAIETTDKTLLVSAAAGSGKTATLVERIVRTVTDKNAPADISRMLIVTYTKAAAGELRERIHSQISAALLSEPGNRHLQKQMILVESAKISTIHAFCLELIRSNFQRLSLSPSFRVADEAELALLCRNVMNDTIDAAFDSDTDPYGVGDGLDFASFVDTFAGSRDDKNLCDIFMSLYQKLTSYPEGVGLLDRYAKDFSSDKYTDFFDTPCGSVIKEKLISAFSFYKKAYDDACEHLSLGEVTREKYLPAFEDDRTFIDRVLDSLTKGRYDNTRDIILSYKAMSLKSIKSELLDNDDIFFVGVRNDHFKPERKKYAEDIFALDGASLFDDMKKTARLCGYLYRFLADFETALDAEKKRRGICGFNDLERYALALLYENGEKSDLALSVSESFDYVYIDEYQDVNAVQDMIFSAISKPDNRFMVGDIKQSIYGFRGAEPGIFAHYRALYPDISADGKNSDCAAVFMSDNFRCDESVVDFVNTVSRYTMCYSSIDYRDEDDLIFKKNSDTGDTKAKLWLFGADPQKGDDDEAAEEESTEAECVADEIDRLIKEEKKNDGTPIRAKDVAILMQSVKKSGPAFVRALKARGIACANTLEDDFFETPEVLLVLCLMNVIDNPRRDIYLAGLLRSPLYNFTMDDLVSLRDCDDGGKMSLYDMLVAYTEQNDFARGRYFLSKLEKYREMASGMAVDRLIWALYRDTAALSLLTRDEKSGRILRDKKENLIRFYEYARSFEASSFKGLYNFIKYINSMIEEGASAENAKPGTAQGDAVRIMTIHQSKGLEMPVCFVSDAAKPFNKTDTRESLLFDYGLGVAMKLRDQTGFARYSTLCRDAIAKKIEQKQAEEYMRVLYVALTRARERLYVTATLRRDLDSVTDAAKLREKYPCPHLIDGANCFLDWILPALSTKNNEQAELSFFDSEYKEVKKDTEEEERECIIDRDRVDMIAKEIREKLDFVYPYGDVPNIPAKVSVSRLYPDMLDPDAQDADAPMPEMKSAPAFVSGSFAETAAERGTATHVFMQFCDFDLLDANNIKEEIARLVEKRFISQKIADMINISQIEKFAKSTFFARMKKAKTMRREFRFNIDLPAELFAEREETKGKLAGETVLVQGVIDCFFEEENGDIILCDYKTDHLTREEISNVSLAREKLIPRHKTQLEYYKKAIEKMCGRAPAHTYIYSLPLGDVIEL